MSKLRFAIVCLLGFAGLTLLLRLTKPTPVVKPRRFVLPQTWHLSGWRRLGEKQVPWEIWGRRYPAFAYERLGESRRWSTGERETFVTPPLSPLPSLQIQNADAPPNNRLLLLQNWGMKERDTTTELPLRYRIQLSTEAQPSAELVARYNLPLPTEVLLPRKTSGATIDLLSPFRTKPSQPNRFIGQGVTLDAEVLAEDEEGSLRVRTRLLPGDDHLLPSLPYVLRGTRFALQMLPAPLIPPTPSPPPPPSPGPRGTRVLRPGMSANPPLGGGGGVSIGFEQKAIPSDTIVRDDQKKNYLLTFLPRPAESATVELQLIRLNPKTPQMPRPKTITFPVYTELWWASVMKPYYHNNAFYTVSAHPTLSIPVNLPRRTQTQQEKQDAAWRRGIYYHSLTFSDTLTNDEKRTIRDRALHWFTRSGKPAPKSLSADNAPR